MQLPIRVEAHLFSISTSSLMLSDSCPSSSGCRRVLPTAGLECHPAQLGQPIVRPKSTQICPQVDAPDT